MRIGADAFVQVERQDGIDQITEPSPDQSLVVCKNEGSSALYLYDEHANLHVAAMESRQRLQLSNGYTTLGGYALGPYASLGRTEAYLRSLPEDQKVDCGKPALNQRDKLEFVLHEISRYLPFYQPVMTIPNYKIIAGYNLTLDPRESPYMPKAECRVMTIEEMNQLLRAKHQFVNVANFQAQSFCRK